MMTLVYGIQTLGSARTGKSVIKTLRDLDLAEQSGMLRTNKDGSVEIK
jgi:hypothetical protein